MKKKLRAFYAVESVQSKLVELPEKVRHGKMILYHGVGLSQDRERVCIC